MWIMCIITTRFGTTEDLSRTYLLSQAEHPPEILLMLTKPQERAECSKKEKRGKGRKRDARLGKKKGLSVNQRFPRRARVIASGQRERENGG